MPISKQNDIYVWVWLPGETTPVVCGRLIAQEKNYVFVYGESYLARADAIALDPVELPLQAGPQTSHHEIHRVIRDAAPDSWGRRVILYQQQLPISMLDERMFEIHYLLHSNSNRIGAMHFQTSPDVFHDNAADHTTIEQLMRMSEIVEAGEKMPAELNMALLHGTSIGGARPKAFVNDALQNKQFIAKFSSTTDYFPIVKVEHAVMLMAKKLGLHVANTNLLSVMNKEVLLVERFDRQLTQNGNWAKRWMISALTALELHEMEGRYASYLDLTDFIRKWSREVAQDLQELYRRMVYNILIGNTDDHARNHAFFWDGQHYALTPAYDICAMLRMGHVATQAMQVGVDGAKSTLSNALSACERFGLSKLEAVAINEDIVAQIKLHWPDVCDQAKLSERDRQRLSEATVLSDYCFE